MTHDDHDNPYRAPRSHAADGDPRHDWADFQAPVVEPPQAIPLSGVLGVTESFDAALLDRGGRHTQIASIAWCIILGLGVSALPLVYVVPANAPSWALFPLVGGCAAVLGIGSLLWYWPRMPKGLPANHELLYGEPVRRFVSEEGVRTDSEVGSITFAWSAYANYRQDERVMLLYQPWYVWDILPRWHCACDSDWEALVALVERKLPKRRQEGPVDQSRYGWMPPKRTDPIASDWQSPAVGNAERLTLTGEITWPDWRRRYELRWGRSLLTWRGAVRLFAALAGAMGLIVLGVVPVALAGPAARTWSSGVNAVVAGAVVAGLAGLSLWLYLALNRLLTWYVEYRHWKDSRQEVLRRRVNEHGIRTESRRVSMQLPWTSVVGYAVADDFAVIDGLGPAQYSAFPRAHFASDADWEQFVLLVERKMPHEE